MVNADRFRSRSNSRILVVYGMNDNGSRAEARELARKLTDALAAEGLRSETFEAEAVDDLDGYDGVVVGQAGDHTRWQRFAYRFARRHASELRNLPSWFLPAPNATGAARDRSQVVRWARAIALALLGPSFGRGTRPRQASYAYLGGIPHGARNARGRSERRSRRRRT